MAVYIETSQGDFAIDLFVDDCPIACKNFLKLCKIKYYHNCNFHNVQRGFIAQTGDPTSTGKGGSSIYGLLFGEQARLFQDEIHPHLRHTKKGMVAMASGKPDQNASQFYITTGENLQGLDDKHTIFGEVAEGMDVLATIDRAIVDEGGRPLKNIRIRRTEILDDPFDDPDNLDTLLRASPEPQFDGGDRLEEDWQPTNDERTAEEVEAEIETQKAANRKVVLEMIGDRPEADAKPPDDMIFVCKLNPVTSEEDLETIFCRFGTVTACDIVRDKKTGDSLNYAFIGFDSKAAAEEAYLKMNNALVDDRRIKVDFSQSMFHLWKQFRRFGKDGDASMKRIADDHGRGGPGGPRLIDNGRFELTTGTQHGYGTGHYSFVHGPDSSQTRRGRDERGSKRRRSPPQPEPPAAPRSSDAPRPDKPDKPSQSSDHQEPLADSKPSERQREKAKRREGEEGEQQAAHCEKDVHRRPAQRDGDRDRPAQDRSRRHGDRDDSRHDVRARYGEREGSRRDAERDDGPRLERRPRDEPVRSGRSHGERSLDSARKRESSERARYGSSSKRRANDAADDVERSHRGRHHSGDDSRHRHRDERSDGGRELRARD